ncbi:hypothetical protein GYA25_03365 [Candidatus Woesearchaeota archaeon]|jgi:hypothetical protein|nr:hypothetical protein [Candidatus Woesearchaeota archaeon]
MLKNIESRIGFFPLSGQGSFILKKAKEKNIYLMNFSDIVKEVLDSTQNSNEEIYSEGSSPILNLGYFKYYDTTDSVINHPSGEVLICLNQEELLNKNKNLEITLKKSNGYCEKEENKNGWFLSNEKEEAEEIYNQLKRSKNVIIVPKNELEKSGVYKTKEEALNSEVLRFLFRDKNLHKEFVDYFFKTIENEKLNKYGMPIFFGKTFSNIPEIGVIRLGNFRTRAYLIRGGDDKNRRYSFFGKIV